MIRAPIILILIVSLFFAISEKADAKRMGYSDLELNKMADLVIQGEVVKVVSTEEVKDVMGSKAKVSHATMKVDKFIKGKSDNTIIVEFAKDTDFVNGIVVEIDCRDAQYNIGEKGMAYLKRLPNGHYETVAGWHLGFKPLNR